VVIFRPLFNRLRVFHFFAMTAPDHPIFGEASPEVAPVSPASVPVESVASHAPPGAATPGKVNLRALLETLAARYPAFRDVLPLTIGIDKQLLQQAEALGVSKKQLRLALALHTRSTRYLKVLTKATRRFDLNGQEAEVLSEEHRQYAAEMLHERQKHHVAERRAREGKTTENNRSHPPKREGNEKKPVPGHKAETAPDKEGKPQKPTTLKKTSPPAHKTKQTGSSTKTAAEEKSTVMPMAEKLALLAEKFARH
jgi:ProP effector